MATLNLTRKTLAWEGDPTVSNPSRRLIDWDRQVLRIPVQDAGDAPPVRLAPGETRVVFNGGRTLTADGTTEYQVSLTSLDTTRYRLSWTGVGTSPGFRTARALSLSPGTVTFALQANLTMLLSSSLGAVFGAVQAGDTVTVAGLATGETPFTDPLNEGDWAVLAATATQLTMARPAGLVFAGASQAGVAVAANSQVLAYASTGVQEGDKVALKSSFPAMVQGVYPVLAATSRYLDFESDLPLAGTTATPGATGVLIYTQAKRWIAVEADQEVVVSINGSTSGEQVVVPWIAGNEDSPGWYELCGVIFSLSLTNTSSTRARCLVFSAE
jgi:hypothetical protein